MDVSCPEQGTGRFSCAPAGACWSLFAPISMCLTFAAPMPRIGTTCYECAPHVQACFSCACLCAESLGEYAADFASLEGSLGGAGRPPAVGEGSQ
eukprot:scaffold313646_cov18-Tisochrysis_lutea.AAC.1